MTVADRVGDGDGDGDGDGNGEKKILDEIVVRTD